MNAQYPVSMVDDAGVEYPIRNVRSQVYVGESNDGNIEMPWHFYINVRCELE